MSVSILWKDRRRLTAITGIVRSDTSKLEVVCETLLLVSIAVRTASTVIARSLIVVLAPILISSFSLY
jgi:hypothetical protein